MWAFSLSFASAQTDSLHTAVDSLHTQTDSLQNARVIDINAPAKAAFYSAVIPGLGQAYNKQYWKIPLVYAALGTGIYFYRQNQMLYRTYRRAYQQRLSGQPDDYPQYSLNVLVEIQQYYRRNRDISLMLTLAAYALNIIDANVSAHLRQWNIDGNLTFRPVFWQMQNRRVSGISLTLTF